MTYVGGFRERLIGDSIHLMLKASLTALGWLGADPNREPVTYLPRPAGDGEKIKVNTLCVSSDRVTDSPLELGSDAQTNTWQWYVDVYAEDEAVGVHLSGDIRDILRGKLPSVGASRPVLDVYDFTMATPAVVFTCDIENVTRDRPPSYTHPWQQFFFIVPFTIVDTYDSELDTPRRYGDGTYGSGTYGGY